MKWLTTQQACEYLSISRTTLHRFLASGSLAAGRVGRSLRFSIFDLDALVCGKPADSMKQPAGNTEDDYAVQNIPEETNRRTGNCSDRPESIPSTRSLERSTNGPKEDSKRNSDNFCTSGRVTGTTQGNGIETKAYQAAVQGLRRAVDEGTR